VSFYSLWNTHLFCAGLVESAKTKRNTGDKVAAQVRLGGQGFKLGKGRDGHAPKST